MYARARDDRYVGMWRPEVNVRSHSSGTVHLILKQSLIDLVLSDSTKPAGRQQGIFLLRLPSAGIPSVG